MAELITLTTTQTRGGPTTRWIGFDMDECVGQLMPVAQFTSLYDNPKTLAAMLLPFEICGELWLLRPGFHDVIVAVADAYKRNQIAGAFLYSNNKLEQLVEFARALLNLIARDACGVEPFRAGFHRRSIVRETRNKHYADVCNLLHCVDLPVPSSPDDLLYFDDRIHPLATEIPHYVHVSPYTSWTPVEHVIAALGAPLDDAFTGAATRAHADQLKYATDAFGWSCPPVDTTAINAFMSGICAFLGPQPVLD